MSFRTVALLAVAIPSVAAASPDASDDLLIAPTCANIDETRDTLPAADALAARDQLARALEDADLLVVDEVCTDRYLLSHEHEGDDVIVRLAGPAGVRRVRNPGAKPMSAVYARLVDALLDAQEEAAQRAVARGARAAATVEPAVAIVTEPTDTNEPSTADDLDVADDDATAIQLDNIVYARFIAGNYGAGGGFGLRIPFGRETAFDVSMSWAGGDSTKLAVFASKLNKFVSPDASTSAYWGGGASIAQQHDGAARGRGLRLEAVLGVAFNRTGGMRSFLEASFGLPLFTLEDAYVPAYGSSNAGYSPTFLMSFGVGG